jgi:divalent metal cation (Fe/Co/Zn/Cd) transporter
MLQKPILSDRVGKWAYALVEYDLHCELIKSMRGQIVADFIVEHRIDKQLDLDVDFVTFTPWKLHFDGLACRSGCGVGIIIISPNGAIFEAFVGWIISVLIIKLSMKLSCLAYKFYMTWV